LQWLRSLCDEAGVVLIFDDVISGFRAAYGGAQALYGVTPDLTCLGKIIGGGLPVGAYGGRREIMEQVSPLGPAYQAGTLSGNPLAMTAGIETLRQLSRPGVYERLETLGSSLQDGLDRIIREREVPAMTSRVGSVMTLFFHAGPIVDYPTAAASDRDRFAAYFHGMLKRGCYLAPSQFEALFLSLAHTEQDIQQTLEAAAQAIA
ncbi:MAG: aminotransferase class III-fold pyridoxal phosphate-dependent enzyme, partial [Chloroflexi bacterium]|nr:aminotransferase class III-fold pyridoxal phosphate-dependent enzyme [Chloroflexota bacterium]